MRSTILMGAVVVVAVGCRPDDPIGSSIPTDGTLRASRGEVEIRATVKDLDQRQLDYEDSVPGFGGLYFDSEGDLNLQLVSSASSTRATEFFNRFLAARQGRFRNSRGEIVAPRIRVVAARYSWRQLLAFRRALAPVYDLPGVLANDADEAANVVRIAVDDETTKMRVARLLTSLGIPADAVNFRSWPHCPLRDHPAGYVSPVDWRNSDQGRVPDRMHIGVRGAPKQ